jgi:type I restriction enzyme S subunit
LEGFQVFRPGAPEQVRVAKVLDTLDTTIRQTEAIIDKLKQVKQGLLHDLLTRGIDANGELRPPQSQAPHLYKDSPLGWIPREWRHADLGNLIDGAPRNGIYKAPGDIGAGALLVGQTAFTAEGSVDFTLARRARITGAERELFGLVRNDLLVSRVFATREGVGQPVIVPAPLEPAVFESNMMRLRIRSGSMEAPLVFHWLKGRAARAWITARAFASNQASINRETLCSVPVAVPPPREQGLVLAVVRAHEDRARHEAQALAKARKIKAGLMDDLLTGRVRVTPLLDTAAHA